MNQTKSVCSGLARSVGTFGLLLFACAGVSNGQVVSFNFSGTIENINDPNSLLPADIIVGTSYSGSLSYNGTGVTDFDGADPNNGLYRFEGATVNQFSMTVNVGSHVLSWNNAPSLASYIQAQLSSSHLLDFGSREPNLDGVRPPGNILDFNMNVTLQDSSQTALSSDALPSAVPVLGQFNDPYFRFSAYNGADTYDINGRITSLTPVPEPATAGLVAGVALLGLGFLRKKRSAS